MKKILSLILITAFLCSTAMLFSCGGEPAQTSGTTSSATTEGSTVSSGLTTATTATTATTKTTGVTTETTSVTTETTEATTTAQTTPAPVVTPILPESNSLKVLAIGNSFSVDAMEYLYDIAKSAGYTDIVLGNLYIGGCSLETHAGNITKTDRSYDFYVNKSGKWTNTKSTLATGVNYEDWDCISLQQVSGLSGVASSYEPYLTELVNYVKKACPDAKLVWHMTWAYQGNSSHSDFAKYGRDQNTMYQSILSAAESGILEAHKDDFAGIIPSGTAIQNIRTSYFGDTVTRDGYHLSYDIGRYTAALTWLKAITGTDLSKVTYVPEEYRYLLGTKASLAAKEAAEKAVLMPFEVSASSYVNDMDKERKEADLTKLGLDPDDYISLELDIVPYAYYNSISGMALVSKAGGSTAGNIYHFAASRLISLKELPAGSVIVLESGWCCRPEGWRYAGAKNSEAIRPATVSDEVIHVTSEWWGKFIFRAFNLSKADGTALTEADAENAVGALRVYVPKS